MSSSGRLRTETCGARAVNQGVLWASARPVIMMMKGGGCRDGESGCSWGEVPRRISRAPGIGSGRLSLDGGSGSEHAGGERKPTFFTSEGF